MSLQGSFETIALPDLMALLSASTKSGELRVVGGHVEGRLWLQNGRLVASKVGKAQGHVDALFELLRLTEGNFVFRDGIDPPEPGLPTEIDPVVREAGVRLREWQDIVQVVPSAEHRVRLIPDLPTSEVTLSAEDWRLVMAIALAGSVQGVLEELQYSQFDGFRGIRHLVDEGLVLVDPPRTRPATPRSGRRVVAGSSDEAPVAAPGFSGRRAEAAAETVAARETVAAPEIANAVDPLVSFRPRPARVAFDAPEPQYTAPVVQLAIPQAAPEWYEESDDVEVGVVHHFPLLAHDAEDDAPHFAFSGFGAPASTADYLPEPPPFEARPESIRGRLARQQLAAAFGQDPVASEPLFPTAMAPPEPAPVAPKPQPTDGGYGGDSGGESINRGLLLKFLSSVRS